MCRLSFSRSIPILLGMLVCLYAGTCWCAGVKTVCWCASVKIVWYPPCYCSCEDYRSDSIAVGRYQEATWSESAVAELPHLLSAQCTEQNHQTHYKHQHLVNVKFNTLPLFILYSAHIASLKIEYERSSFPYRNLMEFWKFLMGEAGMGRQWTSLSPLRTRLV